MSNQNLTDEQYWIAHANATRMERVGGGFHANLGKTLFSGPTEQTPQACARF